MPPLQCHPNPPLIAHLTTSLDMGGAQIMLAKLIEAAAGRSRHPRHSVVSLMPPGTIASRLHASHCSVYDLGMKRGWPTPRALLRLLRIMGAIGPDLAQGWMYHGNVAASIAGAAHRIPVVWNIRHSLNQMSCESRSTRILLALSARMAHRANAIVYNSRTAAAEHEAIGFPSDLTIIIPNGFDCARFNPDRSRSVDVRSLFGISEGPMIVGMVARLHPMKDHIMLVEAVRLARAAGHDLHLLMVGAGLEAPPEALARAIDRALPADRITLADERTDISDWLAGIDVAALPSSWGEAFPNIVGEAMACGVPCVVTSIGDCEWIVGEGGIAVPPRHVDDMARALIHLAEIGPEERRLMGAAGRARVVEHFTLERVANQYRRMYEDVLAEPASVRRHEIPIPSLPGVHPA
jgi:glycosyltransferase involved in cell wall biosynthesis